MNEIVGILLAGGRARRMGGGDKCLRTLGGETLLARAIARAEPQVGTLVLNANGDPSRFDAYGLPVIRDVVEGYAGPLAGVLSGLEWAAAERPDAAYVATMPTDAPFFPGDFVRRLADALHREDAELACATSGGRGHPVFGLWSVRLKDDLRAALVGEGLRKIDVWTARHRLASVEFEAGAIDPFFNANTPEDLVEAESYLARGDA
jgi:molybdopterin-guanine dinucleotide biosynthesis protein A